MAISFTDAKVIQTTGSRLEILTSDNAEYTQSTSGVGVILMAPTTEYNGGPQRGKFPVFYNITGSQNGQSIRIENVVYVGLTPDGNSQFTSQNT